MRSEDIRADCLLNEDENECIINVSPIDDENAPCLPPKLNYRSNYRVNSDLDGGDQNSTKLTKYKETTLDDHATQDQPVVVNEDKISSLAGELTKLPTNDVCANGKIPMPTCKDTQDVEGTNTCSTLSITNECTKAFSAADNNTLREETYDYITDSTINEFTPLKIDDSNADSDVTDATVNGGSVTVIEHDLHLVELSWQRVLEEHKERRAREAVAALNQQRRKLFTVWGCPNKTSALRGVVVCPHFADKWSSSDMDVRTFWCKKLLIF